MSKPFKTYRQQLNILRSRNLIIDNGSKAIDITHCASSFFIV